jgi:hypothetical protein
MKLQPAGQNIDGVFSGRLVNGTEYLHEVRFKARGEALNHVSDTFSIEGIENAFLHAICYHARQQRAQDPRAAYQ